MPASIEIVLVKTQSVSTSNFALERPRFARRSPPRSADNHHGHGESDSERRVSTQG